MPIILMASVPQFPPYCLPFEDQNMFCKQKTRAQPNAVLKDPRLTCTGLRSKE